MSAPEAAIVHRVTHPAPPAHVLTAFAATGTPILESGGQGRTWRAGGLILKPCGGVAEAVWTAEVLSTLTPSWTGPPRFRVAAPVAASTGAWVVSGWQAWQAVTGQPDVTRCTEVLDVADAFHQAIAGLPRPAFLDTRDDPWTYGDRVAWEELPVNPDAVMAGLLQRLALARRPVDLPAQPVHGDLLGNVLFADGLPPAVVDWPVYFRPALWAQAVAVVDALTWCGADRELVGWRSDHPAWRQMLIRALIYRIATNEGCRQHGHPVREHPEGYQPIVDLVLQAQTPPKESLRIGEPQGLVSATPEQED
jgi:uncharacterized protein (TIGR02569 family)